MKKLSIVLLALLLAGGFAVAAELSLDGEVSANFGLDFDADEYGFYHDNTADFDVTWTTEGSSAGEGDLYAEINWVDVEISIDGTPAISSDAGDLSAKIVGPDWEVLLSSPTSIGNAEAPDMDQDGDTDPENVWGFDFDPNTNSGEGITLNYQGVSASANFWNDGTDSFYAFSAGYSADLAEGVTAGVDVGLDDENIIGSLTASYAMDMLTADFAFDFGYGLYDPADTNEVLAFDTSVAVAATPVEDVTVDMAAYYEAANEDIDVFGKVAYAGIEDVDLSAWGYVNDSGNASDDSAAGGEDLEAWAFGMDASYVYDIFTPYVSLGLDASDAVSLKVGTGIAIIDNAAVDVNYDNSDLANNSGKVNASVTVSL